MALFSVCSPGGELSEDGRVITATTNERMASLGPRTPRFVSGEIVFSFTVLASRSNLGANMALGVAAVSLESQIEAGRGSHAWGYNPFSGRLCFFEDCVQSHFSDEEDGKVISECLRGCAVGSTITVRADMLLGKLAFSVNGAAFVDSGVELPTTVRPWAKLQLKGDAVEISDSLGPLRAHFEPFTRFTESSPGMAVAEGGRKAIAVAGSCAALGPATMSAGEHVFHFIVRASSENLGGYIAVGVADGTSDRELSRGEGVEAWGFSPYTGHLGVFADSLLTPCDAARRRDAGGGRPLAKSLRGNAVGSKISVLVDTENHRLAFSVDDGAFVDAGVVLPVTSVRPWVRLGLPGDCVEFTDCSLPSDLHLERSAMPSPHLCQSIADPEHQTAWLSARWLQCTQSMEISSDGRVCRAKAHRHCAVIGPATPNHGVHFFTFTVLRSQFGLGDGMGIGICEWNEDRLVDDLRRGGQGFGFVPSSGRFGLFTDLIETPANSALKTAPEGKPLSGSLRGHAVGSVVTVRVDMSQRSLAFSINGKKFVEPAIRLPQSVRPWAQLCHEGDEVEFTKSCKQQTCELAARRRSSMSALGEASNDSDAIPPDCPATLEAPWEVISGTWRMSAAWFGPHCTRRSDTDLSLVLWGEREARDYTFQATVTVLQGVRCGLAFRARSVHAYYVLCFNRETGCAELWEQAAGLSALARRGTFEDACTEKSCTLRLAVTGSQCSLFMNEKLQATETVEALAGQVGLWAWNAEAVFADLNWTSSPADDPFHTIVAKPVLPLVVSQAELPSSNNAEGIREVPGRTRSECCF